MTQNKQPLRECRVAILVADGFEEIELTSPRTALHEAGARTSIVSPNEDKVRGWQHDKWGDYFSVEKQLDEADPNDYDALLLPGGVLNPDQLRANEKAQRFIHAFFESHKPVAAICHGPWTLIDAGVAEGRRMTSYHSIRRDLINAGAEVVDCEVVHDNGLVTSRNPDDLPAFNDKIVEVFAHKRQPA